MDAIGKIKDRKYVKNLSFLLVLLSYHTISINTSFPSMPLVTQLWWIVNILYIFFLYKISHVDTLMCSKIVKFWFIFIFIHIPYAMYMASGYTDYKELCENLMFFSLPLSICVFGKPERFPQLMSKWFIPSWLILVLVVVPFCEERSAYAKLLIPYTLILFFLPALSKKVRIMSLLAAGITLIMCISDRSDWIKMFLCLVAGVSLYKKVIIERLSILFGIFSKLLFFSPLLFVLIALTTGFNILKLDEWLVKEGAVTTTGKNGEDEDLASDSRTILYEEAILSAFNHNYIIQGRSMSRGYESPFFAYIYDEVGVNDRPDERRRAESLIVSVFTYFGLIGILIYFIIFWIASKKAIYESKNIYSKLIGLYLSFRWLWLWIEDYPAFDLNNIFLWLFIAICLSPSWRNLNNKEVESIMRKI